MLTLVEIGDVVPVEPTAVNGQPGVYELGGSPSQSRIYLADIYASPDNDRLMAAMMREVPYDTSAQMAVVPIALR